MSGEAGITGNNQDPLNWGPPSLVFASDIASLGDAPYGESRNATHASSTELMRFRGRHTVTFGGEARLHHIFSAVAPVLASRTGALTGTEYPSSLLHADPSGIQPRLGIAWRPVPGSSLVIRAGYGLYRNTNVWCGGLARGWWTSARATKRSCGSAVLTGGRGRIRGIGLNCPC